MHLLRGQWKSVRARLEIPGAVKALVALTVRALWRGERTGGPFETAALYVLFVAPVMYGITFIGWSMAPRELPRLWFVAWGAAAMTVGLIFASKASEAYLRLVRERSTLLLALTSLSPRGVLVWAVARSIGEFSRILLALSALLAFPLGQRPDLWPLVPAAILVVWTMALLAHAFVALAVICVPQQQLAILLAFALIVACWLLGFAPAALEIGMGLPIDADASLIAYNSPPMLLVLLVYVYVEPWAVVGPSLFWLLLAGLFVWVAACLLRWRLSTEVRPVGQEEGEGQQPQAAQRRMRLPFLRGNPCEWREYYIVNGGDWPRRLKLLVSLAVIGAVFMLGKRDSDLAGGIAFAGGFFGLLVWCMHLAGIFRREVEGKTLECLLLTPLEDREIVRGMLGGAARASLPYLLLPLSVVVAMLGQISGWKEHVYLALVTLLGFVVLAAISVLLLESGLAGSRRNQKLGRKGKLVVSLVIGGFLLVMGALGYAEEKELLTLRLLEQIFSGIAITVGVAVCLLILGLGWRSWRRMNHALREHADTLRERAEGKGDAHADA